MGSLEVGGPCVGPRNRYSLRAGSVQNVNDMDGFRQLTGPCGAP